MTLSDGGATVGYCAIGNSRIDTPPTTRMNSAITHAKIGRSMKKRAMRGPPYDLPPLLAAGAAAAGATPEAAPFGAARPRAAPTAPD